MEILGKMEMLVKRDGAQGRTFLYPKVDLIRIHRFPKQKSKLFSLFSGALMCP